MFNIAKITNYDIATIIVLIVILIVLYISNVYFTKNTIHYHPEDLIKKLQSLIQNKKTDTCPKITKHISRLEYIFMLYTIELSAQCNNMAQHVKTNISKITEEMTNVQKLQVYKEVLELINDNNVHNTCLTKSYVVIANLIQNMDLCPCPNKK